MEDGVRDEHRLGHSRCHRLDNLGGQQQRRWRSPSPAADGSYTFSDLTAGDYTITLLTPSSDPGQPSVGTLTDANGNNVTTGTGTVSGPDSIADIQLNDGDTGVNYDFPQLAYPYQLLSKRMLLNTNPGVQHTTPAPPPVPVPEPSSLVLLAVAGLLLGGLRRRWRRCND